MSKNPWFKFYPTDWRGDQALRVCCISARGLWMEMICIMHNADPYGHLLINGHPVTDTQLAALTGTEESTVSRLRTELEISGVYSRNSDGVIYSRRMTRDFKKAKLARANGKSGGNPTLGNKKDISASDNPRVKPPDKGGVKAQTPDTTPQTPERITPNTVDDIRARGSGGGVFKNGNGGGVFHIEHYLDDDAIMVARMEAPGWDIYHLMRIYDEGIGQRGVPKSPRKAFPAWCKLYTKGNPPT